MLLKKGNADGTVLNGALRRGRWWERGRTEPAVCRPAAAWWVWRVADPLLVEEGA